MIRRPRHIEVQILADSAGAVVHLHERDCSVQLRNQKLIEAAPAPGLDEELRQRLLADAIKLAKAANYRNAGTVEFLVAPETGEHYFIECNPRIQVEHTVTEQVTGVDLVEAQFRIAAGASLEDLGVGDQAAVGAPRGFAVQARVTAQGAGALCAYKEPSGPGIRVDAAGYLGYAPPPQFDPLLAKVIGTANSGAPFSAAAERTRRALAEFHVAGLATNLPALQAILAHPELLGGDARTTLLTEEPGLLAAESGSTFQNRALALLEQQAGSMNPASVSAPGRQPQTPSMAVEDGQVAVECPMTGSVVEINAAEGATVAAGDTLFVVTAMKMESEVAAPCSGVVAKALALQPGDGVTAKQVLAAIAPSASERPASGQRRDAETWAPLMVEVAAIRRLAHERLQPGSEDLGVVRQRRRGKLNCRERIDLLLDEGSFQEVVSHAMGYDITKEDLGGWHIHCRNGSVDNLAETEEEAAALTRRFLSYLPSSVYEPPPVQPPDPNDPPDRRDEDEDEDEELFTLIPRKRTTTFDMRKAIRLLADNGSFFEIGPLWGTDQITGFARMNGHPVGVLASDSQHVNGGALTADGCSKLTRHQDLCDLFHLPILNLVDNPGFAVGLEHETAGTIRRGGEWMIASAQATVPIFTVLMRRSFGVAGNNFATPRSRPSMRVAWPAADVGGIPPEGGIEAAYKRQLAEAEDPRALRDELMARIESARGPIGPLSKFQIEEIADPRDTRRLICEWVRTAYRIVSQPARLRPRLLQFRP